MPREDIKSGRLIDLADKFSVDDISIIPNAGSVRTNYSKSEPAIESIRWNGESNFIIKYLDFSVPANRSQNNRIQWVSGLTTLRAYPIENDDSFFHDGGLELELILANLPTSNKFNFSIINWENYDWYYQYPLNILFPDDPTATRTSARGGLLLRPEMVVGSYAIYHKTKSNHIEGELNYSTGKVGHIYRPEVSDRVGNRTWCDLSFLNGVLTITVPQTFLNSAIYPIIVDPTFGWTTTGGSTFGTNSAMTVFTLSESGSITSITIGTDASTAAANCKGLIYSVSGGNPTTIQVVSNATAFGGSGNYFLTCTVGTPVGLSPASYHIGAVASSSTYNQQQDSVGGAVSRYDVAVTYATPQNSPSSSNDDGFRYSNYATYTTGAFKPYTRVPNIGPILAQ